jgi:hypothetical protein
MILDSEEQRQMLLEIINTVPIQGDYAGIKQTLPKMDALVEAIQMAEVKDGKPKPGK